MKDLPVVDWHNHLDLCMLAADKPLGSLYEVWVKADPYKHRAMRICGESERLITGDVNGRDARCPGEMGLLLSKEQVWANYEYFIKSAMPTAEKVGVGDRVKCRIF